MNMKKNTLIVAVLLSITLFSCKKEKTKTLNPDKTNYSELQGDEIISKIKTFKEEIAGSENEEQINLENAVWLLEATINYDFDYSGEIFNQSIYSASSKLETSNANKEINVSSKNLKETYKEIKNIIDNYLSSHINSKIELIDLSFNKERGNIIDVNIVNGITNLNMKIIPDCQPFGNTDYWDSYSGKCGNYSGLGTTSSAWQELTKKLNAKCVTLVCQNGGRIVYTNVSTIQINGNSTTSDNSSLGVNILNPYDITTQGDGITDFCLYVSEASNSGSLHTCLSPLEMNSYVNSIKYLANLNKLVGKEIINYTLQFAGNGALNYQQILYNLTFTSGTKTCYIETN